MKGSSANEDLRQMMSVYRQMVTRLYEARRLVVAMEMYPEISEFLGVEKKTALLERLRQAYIRPSEDEPSHVERLYGDLRHKTVHYPWVGKPEIRDVLRQLGHVPTQLKMEGGELRGEWTALTAALWTLGVQPDSIEWIADFEPRRVILMNTVATWLMLWPVTLLLYAKRQGVELEEIIDMSTLPPERVEQKPGKEP
jgi:hypothetical protein